MFTRKVPRRGQYWFVKSNHQVLRLNMQSKLARKPGILAGGSVPSRCNRANTENISTTDKSDTTVMFPAVGTIQLNTHAEPTSARYRLPKALVSAKNVVNSEPYPR
jgi:hypothetical protein